jgi:energy-converting hydrogenase Eha subunit E
VRRILSTLLVLAAGTIIPAASTLAATAQAVVPTPGSISIKLLDGPAAARHDPRARVYIVDFLPLGSVIHRQIEVSNGSASTRRISLYAGAASISHGTFNIAPGRARNDLTTWITLNPARLTLPPGGSARVTATIAVPRNAYRGERYAGIWAQTATAHSRHKKNVLEVSRVGIRVYLAVGKGGPPAPNFVITSLTAGRQPGGQPAVTAQVRNTGGRALDLGGNLTLTNGPGALTAGPFPAELGTTIAPGQSEPVTVELNRQLPDGPWAAIIHLHSGLTGKTARASITFPRGPGTAPPQSTLISSGHYIAAAAAATVTLLAAIAFTVVRRNRRPARTRAPAGRRS